MKHALSAWVFFWLFSQNVWACALCAIYDPTVKVDIALHILQNRLETIRFSWEFSTRYTQSAIEVYDKDKNGVLDDAEMAIMHEEFSQALLEQHYHTTITLDRQPLPVDAHTVAQPQTSLEGDTLLTQFSVITNRALIDDHILQFNMNDDEGFFGFFPRESGLQIHSDSLDWRLADDSNFYTRLTTLHLIKRAHPSRLPAPAQKTEPSTTNSPSAIAAIIGGIGLITMGVLIWIAFFRRHNS